MPEGRFFSVLPKGEARGANIRRFKSLPIQKETVNFREPPDKWRLIRVKIRDQKVSIDTDGGSTHFTIPSLVENNPFVAENLSPQGGVGIWAQQGKIGFRNAKITPRQ